MSSYSIGKRVGRWRNTDQWGNLRKSI